MSSAKRKILMYRLYQGLQNFIRRDPSFSNEVQRKSLIFLVALLVQILLARPSFAEQASSSNATIENESTSLGGSRQWVDGTGSRVNLLEEKKIKLEVFGSPVADSSTISVSVLPKPGSPSVSVVGTTGSTSYGYQIVARDTAGNGSAAGFASFIGNGNGTLTSSNYNSLTWSSVSGAASYDIYRMPLEGPGSSKLVSAANAYSIASTSGGGRVFIPNASTNYVAVVNTADDSVLANVQVGSSPRGIAILPDDSKAYVSNWLSGTVSVIDTMKYTVTKTITVGINPSKIAIAASGERAYVCNETSKSISVIDTVNDTLVTTISLGQFPTSLAITPDSKKLYVNNTSATVVINTTSNSIVTTLSSPTGGTDIAISSDGSKAYATNDSSNVYVIDTSTDSVQTLGTGGASGYRFVALKEDGTKAYFLNTSGTVSVLYTPGTSFNSFYSGAGFCKAFGVSKDGLIAYSAGATSLAVFDFSTGTVRAQFSATTAGPDGDVVVSPNGRCAYIVNSLYSDSVKVSLLGGKVGNTTGTSFADKNPGNGEMAEPVPFKMVQLKSNPEQTQLLDCSNGNVQVTLPYSGGCKGKEVRFLRTDKTKNLATVLGFDGELVSDNFNIQRLFNQGNRLELKSKGSMGWLGKNLCVGPVAELVPGKQRGCTDWGTNNVLVRANDGKLYGWGLLTNGNLSNGVQSGTEVCSPVLFDPNDPPPKGTYVVDWSASGSNLFVVLNDGSVYGAGLNDSGQLGQGDTTDSGYLKKINYFSSGPASEYKVVKVWTFDSGSNTTTKLGKTFILSNNGWLFACGYNVTGALGIGTTSNVSTPTYVGQFMNPKIKSAHTSTGSYTLLLNPAGDLYVTGYNGNGQLGTGDNTQRTSFTKITSISGPFENVFAFGSTLTGGGGYSAVLASDGTLYMAGKNNKGQLGQGHANANTLYNWFKVASTAAYTTGTVQASGTTVTGTGTTWNSTNLPAKASSLQIGFGSTNPGSISTWYPISSINSTTQITLASSAGSIGAGSAYVIKAIPITNPVVDFAFQGNGGEVGCIALDNMQKLWTWGANTDDSLFYGNSTTQAAPSNNISDIKLIAGVNATGTVTVDVQNTVVWDGAKLRICGSVTNGFISNPDGQYSNCNFVSLPSSISSGAESITDLFVSNNNGSTSRLFILTDHGNLYATGNNSNGVCTRGILNGPTALGLFKIRM